MLLAEVQRDVGAAHGVELLSLLDECLAEAGIRLEEVEAVAVTLGPGSFTGLRVALATAKGLALAGEIPLVAVSTLEALAENVVERLRSGGWPSGPLRAPAVPGAGEPAETSLLWPCLDARKGEVYAAAFAVEGRPGAFPATRRLSPDEALAPGVLARRLGGGAVLAGDGAARYAEILAAEAPAGSSTLLPWPLFGPGGGMVARLGALRLARGERDDLVSLVPRYARRSEAELALERRSGSARDGVGAARPGAR